MDVASGSDDELGLNNEEVENVNIEEELEHFRLQWRLELQEQRESTEDEELRQAGRANEQCEEPSKEDQARFLFLQGVNSEYTGQLYNAIQYYRRAVQLVPDIEFKVDIKAKHRGDRQRGESESSMCQSDAGEAEDDVVDDLVTHLQKLRCSASDKRLCQPMFVQRATHISALPVEVIMYIFKWVVSSELDVWSLEQLSMVCRGFYLCSYDEELWRLICMRVWSRHCGGISNYGSYRQMFFTRPHLRYNGCYIGKSSYYRSGEKGLDDYYKPYHLVEYYRFIRFFPEGRMLMLTTPDEPVSVLPKLRARGSCAQGILYGYYKLTDNMVTAILKRRQSTDYLPAIYRYKRLKNNSNDVEQTFHVELKMSTVGGRANWQLSWNRYSIHTLNRVNGQESSADFELSRKTYPPLMYSRVRSFTALADRPLQ